MELPGPEAIEAAALKAWPGLETVWDGQWVRRAANGYTKRANSVQCHSQSDGRDAVARIAAARQWFRSRGLPPVFRVNPLARAGVLAALDAGGWPPVEHSLVMAMHLSPVEPDPRSEALKPTDPRFLAAQQGMQGYSPEQTGKLAAILGVLRVPACGMLVHGDDGRPMAAALFDIADGMVVAGNVVVNPAVRRQGFGVALMRSGLAWAHSEGCRFATHNVLADNAAAIGLYEGLGYRVQYGYHYRMMR